MDKMDRTNIINLLEKIIASLVSIEKLVNNETIEKEARLYLDNYADMYSTFIDKGITPIIKIQRSEEDIIDFSYRCIENSKADLVRLGENLQFGIIDLVKVVNKLEMEKLK